MLSGTDELTPAQLPASGPRFSAQRIRLASQYERRAGCGGGDGGGGGLIGATAAEAVGMSVPAKGWATAVVGREVEMTRREVGEARRAGVVAALGRHRARGELGGFVEDVALSVVSASLVISREWFV